MPPVREHRVVPAALSRGCADDRPCSAAVPVVPGLGDAGLGRQRRHRPHPQAEMGNLRRRPAPVGSHAHGGRDSQSQEARFMPHFPHAAGRSQPADDKPGSAPARVGGSGCQPGPEARTRCASSRPGWPGLANTAHRPVGPAVIAMGAPRTGAPWTTTWLDAGSMPTTVPAPEGATPVSAQAKPCQKITHDNTAPTNLAMPSPRVLGPVVERYGILMRRAAGILARRRGARLSPRWRGRRGLPRG
jgi:hypothetical protein